LQMLLNRFRPVHADPFPSLNGQFPVPLRSACLRQS
jgi:hypothetical protein